MFVVCEMVSLDTEASDPAVNERVAGPFLLFTSENGTTTVAFPESFGQGVSWANGFDGFNDDGEGRSGGA